MSNYSYINSTIAYWLTTEGIKRNNIYMHASEWPANKPNIIFLSTYTIQCSEHKYVYVWVIKYFDDSCTYLICI